MMTLRLYLARRSWKVFQGWTGALRLNAISRLPHAGIGTRAARSLVRADGWRSIQSRTPFASRQENGTASMNPTITTVLVVA
jgi:hypothetical protein